MLSMIFVSMVAVHPGRTAADGCHYCRTNCGSWGVAWDQRHCHGGGSGRRRTGSSTRRARPKPKRKRRVIRPKGKRPGAIADMSPFCRAWIQHRDTPEPPPECVESLVYEARSVRMVDSPEADGSWTREHVARVTLENPFTFPLRVQTVEFDDDELALASLTVVIPPRSRGTLWEGTIATDLSWTKPEFSRDDRMSFGDPVRSTYRGTIVAETGWAARLLMERRRVEREAARQAAIEERERARQRARELREQQAREAREARARRVREVAEVRRARVEEARLRKERRVRAQFEREVRFEIGVSHRRLRAGRSIALYGGIGGSVSGMIALLYGTRVEGAGPGINPSHMILAAGLGGVGVLSALIGGSIAGGAKRKIRRNEARLMTFQILPTPTGGVIMGRF